MADNSIARQVRRATRNLVITNLALVLAVGVAAWLSRRYLDNFFRGPFPKAGDPTGLAHYYVTLAGTKVANTGVTQIQQEVDSASGKVTSQSTVAHYLVLLDGNRMVVVKAQGADANQLRYTGALVPMPTDIVTRVVTPVEAAEGNSGLRFAGAMLDATGFREPGWIGLALGLPLLGLGLWNLRRAAGRQDPETHPSVRALARYGAPRSVADEIDSEMASGTAERVGGTAISAHWMLHPTLFGFRRAARRPRALTAARSWSSRC